MAASSSEVIDDDEPPTPTSTVRDDEIELCVRRRRRRHNIIRLTLSTEKNMPVLVCLVQRSAVGISARIHRPHPRAARRG